MSFFRKWLAFFFPVKGWRERVLLYKRGCQAWEVPGHPLANKVLPWPVEWIPHRFPTLDEEESARCLRMKLDSLPPGVQRGHLEKQVLELEHFVIKQGFAVTGCTCSETGEAVALGEGVLCVRCGVPLNQNASLMTSAFSPPRCSRCRWPLLLLGV